MANQIEPLHFAGTTSGSRITSWPSIDSSARTRLASNTNAKAAEPLNARAHCSSVRHAEHSQGTRHFMERQRHSADRARQCRTLSAGESQTARMVRSACRTRAGLGSGHTHTDDRPRAANREQHGLTETVEISAGKLAADSSACNIPRRVAWRVQHARAPLSGEGVCVSTFTICVLHAEDALESHRSHTDGRGFQNPPAWRPPLPCSACRTKWGGTNGRTGTVTI